MSYTERSKQIYNFLKKFAKPYNSNPPTNTSYPYITYDFSYADTGQDTILTLVVWTKSVTMIEVNEITDNIMSYIGSGIVDISEKGNLYIRQGTPFAQTYKQEDTNIKANVINLIIKYL